MKITHFYGFLFFLFLFLFLACNEEETPSCPPIYPRNAFSEIILNEEIENANSFEAVDTEKRFIYTDGLLSQFIFSQTFTGGYSAPSTTLSYTTRITYEDHTATVKDEFNNVSVYTLNDKGYAISCIRTNETSGEERNYTFKYIENTEDKSFLSEVTETINGNLYSKMNIDNIGFSTSKITIQIDSYQQVFIADTSSDQITYNTVGIPEIFIADRHPLSLHTEAIYGHLLGEPYLVMIDKYMPEGGDETINYSYRTDDEGLLKSCTETTISSGKEYTRTIYYSFKKAEL